MLKTALALSLVAVVAAGCNSSRFSSMNSQPAPLPAAPSGTVTARALPPPASPSASMTDPAQFPDAPEGPTDLASMSPAADAPELTTGSVAGVWNASVSGQTTPQTKFGAGYRAGPLRCPAPIDGVKSWNVSGSQLSLFDESGSVVARLQSSGAQQFDGQTSTGLPITLSR